MDESDPILDVPLRGRDPKRVLFFGKSMSRSKATGGLVHALRQHGLVVRWLNLAKLRRWVGKRVGSRLAVDAFERFAPDVVFVFCRDLWRPLLDRFRARGATIVVWVEEALDDLSPEYVDYLRQAHVVFINNPSKLDELCARGVGHAGFLMDAFSPVFHYPVGPRPPERDVVFIGSPGTRGQRVDFLARLAREFHLEVYGRGWSDWAQRLPPGCVGGQVRPRRYRRLCATSKVVLGINQINHDRLYFSNRTFMTLACGGFHVTHYVPGLEQVFRDGEHLVWYQDFDDCVACIRRYLDAPEERRSIGEAGRKLVFAEHDFGARVAKVLEVLRSGSLEPVAWPALSRGAARA